MTEDFASAWESFRGEIEAASSQLLADLRSWLKDLGALTEDLDARLASAAGSATLKPSLDSLKALYETEARTLLSDVVDRYRLRRVGDRLPQAFADYSGRLDEAAGRLPVRGTVSPQSLIDLVEDSTGMSLWTELVRMRNRERPVLVRAAVLDGVSSVRFDQRLVEGGLYLLSARATLGLLDPWQLVHTHTLDQLRGRGGEDGRGPFGKARQAWVEAAAGRAKTGEELAETLETRLSQVVGRMTVAVLRGPRPALHRRQHGRIRECESYWARQRTAISSLVDMEIVLIELGRQAVHQAGDVVDGVRSEYDSIMGELGAAIEALRGWQPGDPDPLPHAGARLATGTERVRQWRSAIERHAHRLLPPRLEAVEPRRAVPGLRKPWRPLEPQRIFLGAVATAAGTTESGLLAVEAGHTKILREIDRAHEVVAYCVQAVETEQEGGEQVASEGVANALTLLDHNQRSAEDLAGVAESALVEATASSFYQFLIAFERGRLSLTSHVAREGASRAVHQTLQLSGEYARRSAPVAWDWAQREFRRILVWVGWASPTDEDLTPVETWSYFDSERFGSRLAELPLIYDRLFRPEPVEDRRFLIGRDEEIAALEEARDYWKAGRFAAVVVDGERGSGKTSLLNCALSGSFAGEVLIRKAIHDRLLTTRAVHEFLAAAIGVDVDDLIGSLHQERRVIVVEEAERTFLRAVGGLEAVRELLSLVAETSATNLWILSLTTEGFRFLNRALGLSAGFSHRLHASAVARNELRDAILQRHNLSGLRLEFLSAPGKSRLGDWLKTQTARVETPQEAFFRDLHGLSGGVFRSAFSTWRRQIDRVDHGVLRMRYLEMPDHSRLTQALSQKDLSCLQMILQHGSLTPEEDARVFDCPLSESIARIGHLTGHGLLEAEPVVPGFRVRPEAGILVRAALNGRNLV